MPGLVRPARGPPAAALRPAVDAILPATVDPAILENDGDYGLRPNMSQRIEK